MSTSKKPGTDLAALKARLAKKTKAAKPAPDAVPPPGAAAPPPAAPVPAPGQVYQPPPPPAAEVPAPGQVYQPPPEPVAQAPQHYPDVPAPGQQPQPQPAYTPAAAPMGGGAAPAVGPTPDADDPFGGGPGNFDPGEGLIEGGEVQARGGKGIVLFAALLAMIFGSIAGWLGHKIVDTRARVEVGKKKGELMYNEVVAVADTRKAVALALEGGLEAKIATDAKGASADLEALLADEFDKHPKVDALFGWQLASVHAAGIKQTFNLYEEANRLRIDLGRLATFLNSNAEVLGQAGGPAVFGVMFKSNGAKLVELLAPMCGESLENLEALKPCEGGKAKDALAYKVRDEIGAQPRVVAKGAAPDQAMVLLPDGGVYNYVVGQEPKKNALTTRIGHMKRIKARLEAMTKAEKTAERALKNYSDDPTVDGSSEQPSPDPAAE